MELPVSPSSYSASLDAMVRAVKRAELTLAQTCCEPATLTAGTALAHPQRADDAACNAVYELHDNADDLDAAVAELWRCFEQAGGRCLRVDTAALEAPQGIAERLAAAGYAARPWTLWRWSKAAKHTQAPSGDVQILPARAAYPLTRAVCEQRLSPGRAASAMDHLDEPRLDAWLARLDREPRGVVGVLSLGQVGVLGPVLAETDDGSIADALMGCALAFCQRAAFEDVVMAAPRGVEPLAARYGFDAAGMFERHHAG